jgi:hypothetical protein
MASFWGNLPQYFNPRNSRVKITTVIYRSIVLLHWPRMKLSKAFTKLKNEIKDMNESNKLFIYCGAKG